MNYFICVFHSLSNLCGYLEPKYIFNYNNNFSTEYGINIIWDKHGFFPDVKNTIYTKLHSCLSHEYLGVSKCKEINWNPNSAP